jgi:polyphosphate glucokinase
MRAKAKHLNHRATVPLATTSAKEMATSAVTSAIVEETNTHHAENSLPKKILVIDIGGSKIKMLATGKGRPRKLDSGKRMTPNQMVSAVKQLTHDWEYDAVTIGYPGLVGAHGPRCEPANLGAGWVGFDYAAAFGCRVRLINDAAMQALGSYEGGRMLFLGLGTGLGSALIAENDVITLELGCLAHKGGSTLGEVLGKKGLERLGRVRWTKAVHETVEILHEAFVADYVVLGGGNAKKIKKLVPGVRVGHNMIAFRGGVRVWNIEHVPTLAADDTHAATPCRPSDWRVL